MLAQCGHNVGTWIMKEGEQAEISDLGKSIGGKSIGMRRLQAFFEVNDLPRVWGNAAPINQATIHKLINTGLNTKRSFKVALKIWIG